jgi:hypothetical protein
MATPETDALAQFGCAFKESNSQRIPGEMQQENY